MSFPPGTVFKHALADIYFTFPPKRINCPLTPATPTPLTGAGLSAQLNNIGLKCKDAQSSTVEQYISECNARLPIGRTQAMHIDKQGTDGRFLSAVAAAAGDGPSSLGTGQWEPSATAAGYITELSTVGYPEHFDRLMDKYQGFSSQGYKSPAYHRSERLGTTDAVKTMFVDVAVNASAAVVTGVDKLTLNAVMANAIAPLDDTTARDYDVTDHRYIFLVLGASAGSSDVDGIGVLYIEWRLQVHDYKNKAKDAAQHDTILDIQTRAVIYDNPDVLEKQVDWLKTQFPPQLVRSRSLVLSVNRKQPSGAPTNNAMQKGQDTSADADIARLISAMSQVSLPLPAPLRAAVPRITGLAVNSFPVKNKLKVWNALPTAPNVDVFNTSLPVDPLTSRNNVVTGLLFYAADLICLASLDNRSSKSSSTYSVATTSGFTFSMGQKITTGVKAAAGVVLAKAEVSVSFEVSFSEQWNNSQTETIAFQVPAGAQAYVYKGTITTRYLNFDPSNGQYQYGSEGSFHTNYIVSSDKPLTGDPIYPSSN